MKKLNVSLYVVIPVMFAGLAVLALVGAFQIATFAVERRADPFWYVAAWAAFMLVAAGGCGIVVVRALVLPVRRFVDRVGRMPALHPVGEETRAEDELSRFSRFFERVTDVLSEIEAREFFPDVVGASPAMRGVLRQAMKVAATDSTVLLAGESGTGKELLAQGIHEHSARRGKPFVRINCAAIPEGLLESELFGYEKGAFTGAEARRLGKFELARGGTVFLDEIGDMPLAMQAKILRVIEDKRFERLGGTTPLTTDVRFISATNRDLMQMVSEGRFREDLFYRLNVFFIHLPPLRARRSDIPAVAAHFARGLGRPAQIAPEALDVLLGYSWPSKVRELKNVIERAAIECDGGVIRPEHLPPYLWSGEASASVKPLAEAEALPGGLDAYLENLERTLLVRALRQTGGVQVKAAQLLGIKERSLWHRLKKYEIDVGDLRGNKK